MATALTASRSPLSLTAQRSPFAVPHNSGQLPEHRGLSFWMNRVLEELGNLRSAPEAETVHDLRVAIRRCRSLASVMEEVDPDPAWPEMRKAARKLFRELGELRDAHVMESWIKKFGEKLGPSQESLRDRLLNSLKTEEKELTEAAQRAAAKFDEKTWKQFERTLRQRARIVPIGSLAAECLALERFEEAKELHNRAMRTDKPKPWHELRIGLKKFRYTVESLLPEHYAAWGEKLKRLQDVLGDVHDFDVLSEMIDEAKTAVASEAETANAWQEKISIEHRERIETYRQLTLGKTSVWQEWRHNLPYGKRLESAAAARLSATARAADEHSRRTAQVAKLAMRVFELLRRVNAGAVFREPMMRRWMQATAKLHGVGALGEKKLSPKAARKFLLGLTVPPNWTAEEWDLIAFGVRFYRGPEPKQKNGFSKLTEERQNFVRALAGVLRISRALKKAGVEGAVGLRAEKSDDAILLSVPGLMDTVEIAARLAAAKHLLESVLEKPLILKAVAKQQTVSVPAEEPQLRPMVAAATA